MLNVEGQDYDVLIKEVDYNAMKRCVDEIDFQALVSTEKVHSTAAVQIENREKIYMVFTLLLLLRQLPHPPGCCF